MKTTPKPSVKSSTATFSMDDSCYFPGCRKDANCNCEICLASINATLDLIPTKSSQIKLSQNSKPFPQTPISFNPSTSISTPKSVKSHTSHLMPLSPPAALNSTVKLRFDHDKKMIKREKKESGFGFMMMRLILGLCLIFVAEIAVSRFFSRILQPKLSMEVVRNVGEKSWVLQDLNERLVYVKKELESFVGEKVSDCCSDDAKWEIVRDDLILNSRCILYKSGAEEVSIWGWPLQTSGLLTTALSSASFTILSGRVTEWSNGEMRYSIRKANSSWEQEKWGASVLYLDRNTWILEYKRSALIENARLFTAAVELLKFRMMREVRKMKQEIWLLSRSFGKQYSDIIEDNHIIPT